MVESLELPFVQRGIAEVLLLSVGAGLAGTWIILRGLAFTSHAAGTATFPGLVLADGLGFAAPLGALGAGVLFAVILATISTRRASERSAETALVLVGMLAAGVILASDVFESTARVESLLFGSLLLVDHSDLALSAGVSAAVLLAALVAGRHWVARGFDGEAPGDGTSAGARALDAALVLLVALVTVSALTALGSLLVAALLVLPAATTRLLCTRLRTWQLATIVLCAAEGVLGVLISVELNAPPGATIAVLAGLTFALVALGRLARTRRAAAWTASAASLLVLGACGGTGESTVVATTPLVGDLARGAMGPDAEVRTIIAAGSDPHGYEPRPDDIAALADADLVIASGGEIDEWIAGAMDDAGSNADLLVLSDSLPHPLPNEDPHWWHDPRNASASVERIAAAVGDEPGAREGAAEAYVHRIQALDARIAACLRRIPPERRKLVTDHDAFGHLAARYGLRIVGAVITARTTEAQASAGELADLRETIQRERVAAVFPEESVSGELAEAIAREAGAEVGDPLYGDSLGPAGSEGEHYLGMLESNARAIAHGLSEGELSCP